ncbi:MAG: hypothetical protein PHQ91_12330 [Thermoanaerobaculaceae bacterium]|nr:hypothetical protein [Thermoanaerobaculaceae bacterium]
MVNYSYIPDGMKEVGGKLVPLDSKNSDDLQKLLDTERGMTAILRNENSELQKELHAKEQEIKRLMLKISEMGAKPVPPGKTPRTKLDGTQA